VVLKLAKLPKTTKTGNSSNVSADPLAPTEIIEFMSL